MPVLNELKQQMENTSSQETLTPDEKLKEISRGFIHFCLLNRSMYAVFITAKSSRVDEEEPDLEINKLRVGLFKLIIQVLLAGDLFTSKKGKLHKPMAMFTANMNEAV
jgi:hypothetical protein